MRLSKQALKVLECLYQCRLKNIVLVQSGKDYNGLREKEIIHKVQLMIPIEYPNPEELWKTYSKIERILAEISDKLRQNKDGTWSLVHYAPIKPSVRVSMSRTLKTLLVNGYILRTPRIRDYIISEKGVRELEHRHLIVNEKDVLTKVNSTEEPSTSEPPHKPEPYETIYNMEWNQDEKK